MPKRNHSELGQVSIVFAGSRNPKNRNKNVSRYTKCSSFKGSQRKCLAPFISICHERAHMYITLSGRVSHGLCMKAVNHIKLACKPSQRTAEINTRAPTTARLTTCPKFFTFFLFFSPLRGYYSRRYVHFTNIRQRIIGLREFLNTNHKL